LQAVLLPIVERQGPERNDAPRELAAFRKRRATVRVGYSIFGFCKDLWEW